jgi:hypothetical protein
MAVQKTLSGSVALKVCAVIAPATEQRLVFIKSELKTGPTGRQNGPPATLADQTNAKTTSQRAPAKATRRSKTL